jgi:hypothetical protein
MRIIGKISDRELLKELKRDKKKVRDHKEKKIKLPRDGGADFARFLKRAHPKLKEEYGYVPI